MILTVDVKARNKVSFDSIKDRRPAVMFHNVLTPQINVPPHAQPPRAMTEMTLLTSFEPKSPKDPVVWMPVHLTEVIPTVQRSTSVAAMILTADAKARNTVTFDLIEDRKPACHATHCVTPQINVPPHTQPLRAMPEIKLLTSFESNFPKDPVVWMPIHIKEVIPTVLKEC